ncbi:class III lanthionine synthetase LanKC [Streptomyces sp. WMMC1477]|uniref:class III lanthionine synthetase LanKC n=1 Tax=Streptomyces sp. WMMC1477 TaxID=3015155 RepID=UPI0022B6ABF9|nr:class III lanthionine synthetase LanKC [Streptomyces sp. WMMC1477]MCZ7433630.1 class III lanthionine synthetase LanKC [Streptomyces sp. WMMC1477]
MNQGYAAFCGTDQYFYDTPRRPLTASDDGRSTAEYRAAARPVPDGWRTHRAGDWLALRPEDGELPDQGWKIHVSATLRNAESVLDRVWEYCVDHGLAFKFVPGPHLLRLRNAKYANRGASGKFITVYPPDEAACETTARELDGLLAGEPGPYILSDVRWNQGPVYLRYGSFTRRHAYDESGEAVPAVETPEGVLVPDLRGTAFQVPEWVELPAFLRPHVEARSAVDVTGLPYAIERALHFSNGGGVYQARDTRTGERVVLKEARPHAGLAADGADAVERLHRERRALERLSGLSCAPEVKDSFVLGDHHFLVLEYVEGKPLNSFFARRHPLIDPDPEPERLAEYARWAMRMHALVEQAVEAVHARGIVFHDLHLFNVMVSEDESSVVLLDFEVAQDVADAGRQTVAHPAFVAPPGLRGFDIDRYALACLRLALFLPLTSLLAIDRAKAAHLAEVAAERFPEAEAFLRRGVAEILRTPAQGETGRRLPPVDPGDWPNSGDSLARGIAASVTPDREDRCFPGDIAQFTATGGGLSFAHGAAGVLYALSASGAPRCPEAEEWLLAHAKQPPSGTPLGFYDGLAGLAWTLDHLGHRDQALSLVELALDQPWESLPSGLHGGLAGFGLALDSLAATTGEQQLRTAALRCAEIIRTRQQPAGQDGSAHTGLLRGASGPALLGVRLYEHTGDTSLLDLAADALRQDLDRCVTRPGGALHTDEGWRTLPYVGAGSVGVGMVLDDYLAHRPDERFERARAGIVRAARAGFYAQPGLFRGLAGMVLYLGRTTAPGASAADLRRQTGALAWHAMSFQGHLAFPGEQMMRLSTDLATGSAGVLLALAAAQPGHPAALPFLPPPGRPHGPVPTRGPMQETRNTIPSGEESS